MKTTQVFEVPIYIEKEDGSEQEINVEVYFYPGSPADYSERSPCPAYPDEWEITAIDDFHPTVGLGEQISLLDSMVPDLQEKIDEHIRRELQ